MNQLERCFACHRPAVATVRGANSPEVYGTCTRDRGEIVNRVLASGASWALVAVLDRSSGMESGRWRRVGVRR